MHKVNKKGTLNTSFGIAWDFDGTIIKSQKEVHAPIESKILKDLGIDINDEEICSRYSGVRTQDYFLKLLNDYNIKVNVDQLIEKKWKLMLQEARTRDWEFLPGVIQFIIQAFHYGIKQSIGTASHKDYVDIILERYELKQYISYIVSGDDVIKGKPDPETWLKCAELLKLPPNKIIVIEDGIAGLKAAQKAGMHSIYIGANPLYQADICIKSFDDLDIYKLAELCN